MKALNMEWYKLHVQSFCCCFLPQHLATFFLHDTEMFPPLLNQAERNVARGLHTDPNIGVPSAGKDDSVFLTKTEALVCGMRTKLCDVSAQGLVS